MSFVGKMFISGSFAAIYVYAGELFPTPLRSTGIGFGSMCARFGGFFAPFIIQIKTGFVKYLVSRNFILLIQIFIKIFGFLGVFGGALIFLLPETGVGSFHFDQLKNYD